MDHAHVARRRGVSGPVLRADTRPSRTERAFQIAVVAMGIAGVLVAAAVLIPRELAPQSQSTSPAASARGAHSDARVVAGRGGSAPAAKTFGLSAAPPSVRASVAAGCGLDATASLQRLISSTPNGGVLNLNAGRCYDVESTIFVNERTNLTIDGHGATLRAFSQGTRDRMLIKIRASSGVVVRNLTLWGPNVAGIYVSALEAQHGIGVFGGTNTLIDGVHVKQVYGDGVTLTKAGDGSRAPADHVTIRNSTFETIGRQGISPVFVSNVLISGNTFDRIARTVIDMEPDTDAYTITNVTIENNHSGRYGHLFVGAGGSGCNTSNVVIRNNDSDGGAIAFGAADVTCHKRDVLVEGNTFRLSTGTDKGWWAYFWRVDDVTVRNNRILTRRSLPGVRFLEAGGNLVVTGNTFSGTCDLYDATDSSPVEATANVMASPCPSPPKSPS